MKCIRIRRCSRWSSPPMGAFGIWYSSWCRIRTSHLIALCRIIIRLILRRIALVVIITIIFIWCKGTETLRQLCRQLRNLEMYSSWSSKSPNLNQTTEIVKEVTLKLCRVRTNKTKISFNNTVLSIIQHRKRNNWFTLQKITQVVQIISTISTWSKETQLPPTTCSQCSITLQAKTELVVIWLSKQNHNNKLHKHRLLTKVVWLW